MCLVLNLFLLSDFSFEFLFTRLWVFLLAKRVAIRWMRIVSQLIWQICILNSFSCLKQHIIEFYMLGYYSVVREEIECIHFSICPLSICLTLSLYYALHTKLFFLPNPKFQIAMNVYRSFGVNLMLLGSSSFTSADWSLVWPLVLDKYWFVLTSLYVSLSRSWLSLNK